jgi:hypothetical protein
MKPLKIAVITILLFSVLYLSYYFLTYKSCRIPRCLPVADRSVYIQKENYSDRPELFRALYADTTDNSLLRAEIRTGINRLTAAETTNVQLAQIRTFYEKSRSPYPGEISDTVVCSDDFQPVTGEKTVNRVSITYFSAYMTDRLTYGACIEDQAKYQAMTVIFYCENNQTYNQLEFIRPIKSIGPADPDPILNKLKCL